MIYKFKPFTLRRQTVLNILFLLIIASAITYLFYFSFPENLRIGYNADKQFSFPKKTIIFCINVLFLFVLFIKLSKWRLLPRFIFLFLLFLPSGMLCFLALRYNAAFTRDFAFDILMTPWQEAFAFISVYFLISCALFLLFFLILTAAIGKFKIHVLDIKSKKIKCSMNILLLLVFIFGFKVYAYPQYTYYMAGVFFHRAYTNTLYFVKNYELIKKNNEPFVLSKPLPQNSTFFFHIGESVRADHVPMNGYKRNTTPVMFREFKKGNLFCFSRAISFWPQTSDSFVAMSTTASISEPVIKDSGFLPYLKRTGIKSSAVFSGGAHKVLAIKLLTFSLEEQHFTNKRAHTALPQIEQLINSQGNNFIMYQGEGSHEPYETYDKELFSVYMPVNFTNNADETTINAYDNTIVCLDDFVKHIIDMLKDKNAVYLYASDHGEALGEDGKWNRQAFLYKTHDVVRNILFFIWVSDKFKMENAAKFAALRRAGKFPCISHDYVYHTILGFYNIKNKFYNEKLDLFSEKSEPFTDNLPSSVPAGLRKFKFEQIQQSNQ